MNREERSWVLYDVGNSAFVLVMITALMPIFFKDVAAIGMDGVKSTAIWGFANSSASLILALLSPILGAMADYRDTKKKFFLFFLFIGISFNLLLPLTGEGQWVLCLVLFVFARVGWAGANIFYDAFLVDVAKPVDMDSLSSKGYAYGYVGSVIPFLVIIAIILSIGMADGLPVNGTKFCFVIVALWWLFLSLPAMRNLQQRHSSPRSHTPVSDSFKRLWQTMKEIRRYRQPFLFLSAYFFYIDGVGTIISMSTAYGRDLGFGVVFLILVLLFIQLVAFPFALLYGSLAAIYSTKKMLLVGIGVYCLATLVAFSLPSVTDLSIKTSLFWFVAFLVASSMGGIQALSRSYFGKLIPAEKSAEFFGFYNVFGKFAAIMGPALMGGIATLTGETRWGILSVLLLFVLGGVLLARVEDGPQ